MLPSELLSVNRMRSSISFKRRLLGADGSRGIRVELGLYEGCRRAALGVYQGCIWGVLEVHGPHRLFSADVTTSSRQKGHCENEHSIRYQSVPSG